MKQEPQKIPEHAAIYAQIRDSILFGRLVPGQAVTIQGLCDLIGAGMTPVREAIRRLTSEGALMALGNRRIVVPRLTANQIEELAFARLEIEPKLAEMATIKVDSALIDRLIEIDDALNRSIESGSIEGYLHHNYDFHFALYERADAQILTAISRSLWLRSGPSLRVVCGWFGTSNLPDLHDEAISALKRGDANQVKTAIKGDILQGLDQVRAGLKESEVKVAN